VEVDLDRYYTPISLAEELLLKEFRGEACVAVDSTCGTGNLLAAASNVYRETQCIGLDRDRNAISALRRKNPGWILSVGEILKDRSYKSTLAANAGARCDLLLLNPPFSQGNQKSVQVTYEGHHLKSSIAMANILKSLELFKPKNGAMVIAPESVLFSELDAAARHYIESRYSIHIIGELHNETFRGARVRSTAIKILPGVKAKGSSVNTISVADSIKVNLVRGSMPVHFAKSGRGRDSIPFVHSTDLKDLVLGQQPSSIKIGASRNGRVSGHVVLLTRVGIPKLDFIQPLELHEETQLSDCLFALCCSSKTKAITAARRIRANYSNLLDIYRGTGARYVTVQRLKNWLLEYGFEVN